MLTQAAPELTAFYSDEIMGHVFFLSMKMAASSLGALFIPLDLRLVQTGRPACTGEHARMDLISIGG